MTKSASFAAGYPCAKDIPTEASKTAKIRMMFLMAAKPKPPTAGWQDCRIARWKDCTPSPNHPAILQSYNLSPKPFDRKMARSPDGKVLLNTSISISYQSLFSMNQNTSLNWTRACTGPYPESVQRRALRPSTRSTRGAREPQPPALRTIKNSARDFSLAPSTPFTRRGATS
jgi:hypothetical protein